jgi:FKBP-type peptidyl-prolyl cis-trans isomerase (trigger factor)
MVGVKTSLRNISENEIEVTCEISSEIFETHRKKAIGRIVKEVSLPGFRKGHIPEHILIQRFGEALILEEMANLAIDHAYSKIIEEHKVRAIGRPAVTIKKLAKGNPFEFSLLYSVMPKIKLPDYTKIAVEVMKQEDLLDVTDNDVTKAVDKVRAQFARKNAGEKDVLPELTIEFVARFGPFKTVDEFSQKIRESLVQEKKARAREKKRKQMMDKIADEITAKIPRLLIDGELEHMSRVFRQDVERMGMKFGDYLAASKKTVEDMKKEWETDAEKNVKVQIALNEIAVQEKLLVDPAAIESETALLLEQVKNPDPARVRFHVENLLINNEVFEFLEKQRERK